MQNWPKPCLPDHAPYSPCSNLLAGRAKIAASRYTIYMASFFPHIFFLQQEKGNKNQPLCEGPAKRLLKTNINIETAAWLWKRRTIKTGTAADLGKGRWFWWEFTCAVDPEGTLKNYWNLIGFFLELAIKSIYRELYP